MGMRPEEAALILEQAKQDAKKQQLAGKKTVALTFDGNIEGKEAFEAENNSYMVRISDTPIDLTEDNFVGFEMRLFGVSITDPATISFEDLEESKSIYCTNGDDVIAIGGILYEDMVIDELTTMKKGVYFTWAGDAGYLARLSYSEIHPIPQEYIPPLDRLILNGADGNQYALTITDGALSVAPVTT